MINHLGLCTDAMRGVASAYGVKVLASPCREESKRIFVQGSSAVWYPALCSVTASGLCLRPAAARSSASITTPPRHDRVVGDPGLHRPAGYGFRSKSCSQSTAKDFSGASVNAEPRPWEPEPLAGFATSHSLRSSGWVLLCSD